MSEAGDSRTDVLVIGTGAVGEWAVEFLARTSDIHTLATADTNGKRGEAIALRAAVGALHGGYAPQLTFHQLDLSNVDATASLIRQLRPWVILHTAALLSVPTMAARLGPELFQRLREAGFGSFLPLHLFLTLRLMEAVRQVDDPPDVIDTPFPDFANPALATVGLAPLAGCGNADLISALAQLMVARARNVAPRDVHIYYIASHAVNESFLRTASPGKAPYCLRVYVSGIDITEDINAEGLLADVSRRLQGIPTESHPASSGVKMVLSLLRGDRAHIHAPGPNGLPGGYPVRLSPGKAEVLLPPGLSLEEAVRMNWAGLQVGGIERIDPNGTVYITEPAAAFLRELLGYDARCFRVEEAPERAGELLERFQRLFDKLGKGSA
jgi:hypothetical protein